MKCYLSYLFGLILLIVNVIHSKNIEELSNDDINNNNSEDKYYLIYVNNAHGEYNIFSKTKNQKRQESQVFVESLVDEINSLIIENRDSYQNPEKLAEIEEASQLKKRKRNLKTQEYYSYDESDLVYPISSINNRVVLYAYLSKKLSKDILTKFDSVINVTPNKYGATIAHKNYNETEILAETGWKNLSVRENADFHLSLISQGIFNGTLVNEYDNNYYYPSSAGKDIDIIVFDSSFNFNYSEFSNTDDRIVKCAGNVVRGKVSTDDIDHYCGSSKSYHGEMVSVCAGGITHGVASRANIYGVSFPTNDYDVIEQSDILGGMQFIYENMIRPHKSIVNLSLASYGINDSLYYKQFKELVDGITEKGGIVVAAAGNSGMDINELSSEIIPCEFDNVICVGGIENEDNKKLKYVYTGARYSNYGRNVDLYAPFHIHVNIVKNSTVEKVYDMGTSFSSPIVAGIISTIMGENKDIKYTKKTILDQLYENGKSEVFTVNYLKNMTGILANNGKHIVYSEDGQYNG